MRPKSLLAQIKELAQLDGAEHILRISPAQELAATFDSSVRMIELAALEAGIVPWRYLRNMGTLGVAGQAKLLRATAAVVGLGGLGGYVTEGLARMGVGQLILIDGDKFEEHNLNRQLLCAEAALGTEKARAAEQRVAEVNSSVQVTSHALPLTSDNLPVLLDGADVVVDALDRLPIRLDLQRGAQSLGIPMIHGSIAGFLGQVLTILPGDAGLFGLYGEPGELPEQGLEAQLGTPAATPMAVAAWETQEVVKILTGLGEPLRNRLLIMDMGTGQVDIIRLSEA